MTTLEQIETFLAELESQPVAISTPDDYNAVRAMRQELDSLLRRATSELDDLRGRVRSLPLLPPHGIVRWAQAALRMPLAVIVLETTGLEPDADIIRVSIRDEAICPLLETFVCPVRYRDSNPHYTGLSLEQVMNAPTFDVIYPALVEALHGRYIIAYGLDFVMKVLKKNIELAELPELPPHIGEDLQERTQLYFYENWPIKLPVACRRIGFTLDTPASSDKRAEAQLRLMSAMAMGVSDGYSDEHPF